MNEYSKERAEYLKLRSWDLIDRLERMRTELDSIKDPERYRAKKEQIGRLEKLIQEYAEEYEEAAEEAGIGLSLESGRIDRDLIGSVGRKTIDSGEDLRLSIEIGDIGRFFNVPERNPKFTGRKADVAFLADQLAKGGALAITGARGMGGIGKTAIANELCHMIRQTWDDPDGLPGDVRDMLGNEKWFPDGVLWVAFERDQRDLIELTRKILAEIVDPATAEKIESLETLADIVARKDVLVVLDSVEQNLFTFHHVFKTFKGRAPMLVTSRIAIPGIAARSIDKLPPDEAFDMFVKYMSNPDVNESQAETIRGFCEAMGHFPLAIRIVASKIDEDNGNLEGLKARYERESLALLETDGPAGDLDERHVAIRTCFHMSYDILPARAQAMFRYAAVFREPFTVAELATVAEIDEEEEFADALLAGSLIQVARQEDDEETRYELHPLMREFAMDLLAKSIPPSDETRMAEIRELLESVEKEKEEQTLLETLAANDELLLEIGRAMADCDRWHQFDTAIRIAESVNVAIDRLGRYKEQIPLNRLAVRAAAALQNRAKEAAFREELAVALGGTGTIDDLSASGAEFEKALAIRQRLSNVGDSLFIQYCLASIDFDCQKYSLSLKKLLRGVRDACRHNAFYHAVAFSRTVGWIYRNFHASDPISPLIVSFRSKVWSKDSGDNLLRSFDDLIRCRYAKGYLDECKTHYAKALSLAQEIRSGNLFTYFLKVLFYCFLELGKTDECEKLMDAYRPLAKAAGIAEGSIQEEEGKLAFLKEDYDAALIHFKRVSEASIFEAEELDLWIGKTYFKKGDLRKAEEYLNTAWKKAIEMKKSCDAASVSVPMAELALERDDPEQAIGHLARAVKTKRNLGIVFFKEEEELRSRILERMAEKGMDEGLAEKIESDARPVELKPEFLLDDLPDSIVGKDGKKMLLVAEGSSFVGKGEVFRLSAEDVLNNIDEYLQKATPEQKKNADEATEIYLYPFYMDADAVTNAEYERFCVETRHARPEHWNGRVPRDSERFPVVGVTLEDAKAYARWEGKEIPTEAEWEKACRGADGNVYPWGDQWDPEQVKTKSGDFRQACGRRFEKLNKDAKGIVVLDEKHAFEIPAHPDTDFDEEEFLILLEQSISLTKAEKQRVIDAIPRLKIEKIEELVGIFTEEKQKFLELEEEFEDDVAKLKKERYDEFNMQKYHDRAIATWDRPETNVSPYGIRNMAGDIREMTDTRQGDRYAVKGGSWFSADPEAECRAYHRSAFKLREKQMDVGFRCVKPIFSKDDLPG